MTAVAKFTYAQLEQLWINNGGSKATAPIAAAIAEAESSGIPGNNNYTDNGGTQTSWGLWQISDGTHNQPVPGIDDPNVNAQAAVAKYQASGWEPWGTYTSGAYKAYLSPGTTPDSNVPNATLTAATSSSGASPCMVAIPHTSVCIISHQGVRLVVGGALMGAAGLIILVGMVLVGLQSAPGRAAVQATPIGRAARKAAPDALKAPGKPAPSLYRQRQAEQAAAFRAAGRTRPRGRHAATADESA